LGIFNIEFEDCVFYNDTYFIKLLGNIGLFGNTRV